MTQLRELCASAGVAFAETFGFPATWAAFAPGRVNLIGEHTDYNGGFVLPMAIDRWCVAAGASARGKRSRIRAHDLRDSVELSLAGVAARGAAAREELPGWARYAVGAIVEQAAALGVRDVPEMDLLITSTVPLGSGLSSSASLETACAVAVELATGRTAEPLARAVACQRAEHRWAGVPCGLMDQLASSFGREGHALLIDCSTNAVTPVPLPGSDEAALLVVNSGVHHDLAAGEYAKRRDACESAAARLGVASLRDLGSPGAVGWGLLDDEQARCVRHVVSENARVLAAVGALRAGDLASLGRLMSESHASLRDDYRVSCAELDAIVEIASSASGVLGARMTGGGFGGCAVVLSTIEAGARLREALPAAYTVATGARCTIEPVAAVDGAGAFAA